MSGIWGRSNGPFTEHIGSMEPCDILTAMNFHHFPWEAILFGLIKLLKVFGIIPGAMAAFGLRRLYQKWRQNKAMSGWPATDATIQSGQVQKEGLRYWVELTYTYYVGEYRSGKHVHRFRREQDDDEFELNANEATSTSSIAVKRKRKSCGEDAEVDNVDHTVNKSNITSSTTHAATPKSK